jgi:predicted XRE-type DNA-binding protein
MSVVTESSGNVFKDLDLPDADVLQAKADLVHLISSIIDKRGLTQSEAAAILKVTQPKVSALLNRRIDGFSIERLAKFLNALNQDVKIVVRPRRVAARGRLAVG